MRNDDRTEAWPPAIIYMAMECEFVAERVHDHVHGHDDERQRVEGCGLEQRWPTPSSWRGALMRAMRRAGETPFALRGIGPLAFRLTLWDDEVERAPEWLAALERAGARGVGAGRPRFRLVRVTADGSDVFRDGRLVAAPQPRVFQATHDRPGVTDCDVRLVSPLRICHGGKPLRAISADIFFSALGRRARHVAGDTGVLYAPTFAGAFRADTRYVDQMRYSSRQRRAVGLGGVVGTLRLSNVTPAIRAWLDFGAAFGVGKATAMGCGAIDIVVRD